jgi:hypothetical protein
VFDNKGPKLKDRVKDEDQDYYLEEAFFAAVAYKLMEGETSFIDKCLQSPVEIIRTGAYAAKFDQKLPSVPRSYYGYIKAALTQSSDVDAIVKGLSLSDKFWKAFCGAMRAHFKEYTLLDDLLKSAGVACSANTKQFFFFCEENLFRKRKKTI